MWSAQLYESILITNFNFGFSNYNTDIPVHLSQWQYWWWFWFSFLWVVYYYIIIFCLTKRVKSFSPVLNSSFRSRGKWGDFLVAIVPLSWCGNILLNSNYILRMIEWQNESSLFTLRIQGKQWYWVYKFDSNALQALASAPKNIGHNRWLFYANGGVYTGDNYFQCIHLATQMEMREPFYRSINKYTSFNLWKKNPAFFSVSEDFLSLNNDSFLVTKKTFKRFFSFLQELKSGQLYSKLNLRSSTLSKVSLYEIEALEDNFNAEESVRRLSRLLPLRVARGTISDEVITSAKLAFKRENLSVGTTTLKSTNFFYLLRAKFAQLGSKFDQKPELNENFWGLRQKRCKRYKKYGLKYTYFYDPKTLEITNIPRLRGSDRFFKHRIGQTIQWRIFNKRRSFKFASVYDELLRKHKFGVWWDPEYDLKNPNLFVGSYRHFTGSIFDTFRTIRRFTHLPLSNTKSSVLYYLYGHPRRAFTVDELNFFNDHPKWLHISLRFYDPFFHPTQDLKPATSAKLPLKLPDPNYYRSAIRTNLHRSEILPVTLARRLLRTRRTLVLPIHTNITVITNSYDVVHSWFIPGLGLKLDCVPGRSTHHTLYIENEGFYYGQCAEICGRYHHHMPIRVCALPFDQFLVWWQTRGVPRMYRVLNNSNKLKVELEKIALREQEAKLLFKSKADQEEHLNKLIAKDLKHQVKYHYNW